MRSNLTFELTDPRRHSGDDRVRAAFDMHEKYRAALLREEPISGLAEHIAVCAACGPLARRLQEVDALLAEVEVPGPPPGLKERVLRSAKSWAFLPSRQQ